MVTCRERLSEWHTESAFFWSSAQQAAGNSLAGRFEFSRPYRSGPIWSAPNAL